MNDQTDKNNYNTNKIPGIDDDWTNDPGHDYTSLFNPRYQANIVDNNNEVATNVISSSIFKLPNVEESFREVTAPVVPLTTVDMCELYPSSGEDGDCTIIGENAIYNEAQSVAGSDCLGDTTKSDKKKKRKRSVQHIERNTYRRACTILKRFAHCDVNLLSPLEEKMLARHRRTVARYEAKYPNSAPPNGTPSQTTAASTTLSNNTIMEPIASTSKSHISPFSKPLVNNTVVPFAIEREKGLESFANAQSKMQGTNLETMEDISYAQPSRHISQKESLMKRTNFYEVPSGSKRPKKHLSSGTDPSLQIAFIDRSDSDGKISPEKWDLIEEKLIELMMEKSCDGSNARISSIGWSRGIKVAECENEGTVMFLADAIKLLGEPWPGAQLEVIHQSQLPLRPIVTVWVPPTIKNINGIPELIGKQNDGLDTSSWIIVNSLAVEGKYKGYDIRIAVDNASFRWLRAKGGRVLCGLAHLKVRHPDIGDFKIQEENESAAVYSASL